jgi:quercetin dioxygenase-like cupin family protein
VAFLVVGGAVLAGAELEAQRVVHILDEPRHRTMYVHGDGQVRVIDVQINPGDTTLMHTHDSAILYNFISQGSGPANGRLSSVTSYVEEPFTHAVNNQGPNLFQIIAMPHFGPGISDLTADRPEALSAEPDLENPWYRSYRIELAPGEETPPLRHYSPVLIVQVTQGKTHVTREDGITAELTQMGHWAWRNRESGYVIRNVGAVPLAVNVNEARGVP